MPNFCPKCGGKVNPDDKFCKSCGTNLIGSVEVSKGELWPEKPPAPVQIPPEPSKPAKPSIILNILGLLFGLLILYLIYYSYGCATGKYPNTQDRMCQSIHQSFSGGVSGDGGGVPSGGGTTGGGTLRRGGCPVGYCNSNGYCCPSDHRYYCKGKCYATEADAASVDYRCTLSYKIICD